MARLEGYWCRKTFRPRPLSLTAIYSLTSVLKNPENIPISRKILQGWRMKTGDFERELEKLVVPVADVGADGEIV